MKLCGKCQIQQPYESFHSNKSRHDGLSGWCKKCMYPALKKKKIRDKLIKQQKRLQDIEKSKTQWKDLTGEIWIDIKGYKG